MLQTNGRWLKIKVRLFIKVLFLNFLSRSISTLLSLWLEKYWIPGEDDEHLRMLHRLLKEWQHNTELTAQIKKLLEMRVKKSFCIISF
jgi:hypothetical protein